MGKLKKYSMLILVAIALSLTAESRREKSGVVMGAVEALIRQAVGNAEPGLTGLLHYLDYEVTEKWSRAASH